MTERQEQPERLHVRVGSGFGREDEIELAPDRQLLVRAYEGQGEVSAEAVSPSRHQWRGFLRVLNRLDVWRWRRHYSHEAPPTDGTDWGVEIVWEEKSVAAAGYMAFPARRKGVAEEERDWIQLEGQADDQTNDDYSDDFKDFLRAVSRLIGGREFGGYRSRPKR